MNSVLYFEIQAQNPEKSAHFYEQIFGWKFIKEDSLPITYYRIETTGIHGGLFQRPADTPPLNCGTNAFTCSMEVNDFDNIAALIIQKRRTGGNAKICHSRSLLARIFSRH